MKRSIIMLSISCLLSTLTYFTSTTLLFQIYYQYQLTTLVIINFIFTFLGFGFTNIFVLCFVQKIQFKYSLAFGFCGLLFYSLIATYFGINLDHKFIIPTLPLATYITHACISFIAGLSCSILWTVIPAYIHSFCYKSEYLNESQTTTLQQNINSFISTIGIFWSIFMFSSIMQGLYYIFIFQHTKRSTITFGINLGLSFISIGIAIFILQPQIVQHQSNQDNITLTNQITCLVKIVKGEGDPEQQFPNIFWYVFISGLYLNAYPIFIQKMITILSQISTPACDIKHLISISFIIKGVGSIFMGIFQYKFHYFMSKIKQRSLMWGICFIYNSLFITIFTYNLLPSIQNCYWICFVMLVWCITQIHIKTNIFAYIQQVYKGKIQYYSLCVLFYVFGSAVSYCICLIQQINSNLLLLMYVGGFLLMVWLFRQPNIELFLLKAKKPDTQMSLIEKKSVL